MNSQHFLVCPLNEDLLARLKNRSLVVKISRHERVPDVLAAANKFMFHLHCLMLETDVPLTSIDFQENWKDVPLGVYTC